MTRQDTPCPGGFGLRGTVFAGIGRFGYFTRNMSRGSGKPTGARLQPKRWAIFIREAGLPRSSVISNQCARWREIPRSMGAKVELFGCKPGYHHSAVDVVPVRSNTLFGISFHKRCEKKRLAKKSIGRGLKAAPAPPETIAKRLYRLGLKGRPSISAGAQLSVPVSGSTNGFLRLRKY